MKRLFLAGFILIMCLASVGIGFGKTASTDVQIIPDPDGSEIGCGVSADKEWATISIQLSNQGAESVSVKPGTIYFHKDVLENYSGALIINTASDSEASEIDFFNGDVIILPEQSTASFSVTVNLNMAEAYARTADVSWFFKINSDPVTFTGTIDFAEDEPVQVIGKTAAAINRTLPFYSLTESYMPEALPATGISKTASIRNASLINQASEVDRKGLHLEIPVIGVATNLVSVSLNDEDEWDVAGLTHQAGILSNSALPGKGTTLIAAHNHLNESEAGPFLMLHRLEKNDRIIITDASGRYLFYRVYANELREPTDSQTIYENATPGSLVLFTCEEEMPEGGYAYRRVVYAEPLQ